MTASTSTRLRAALWLALLAFLAGLAFAARCYQAPFVYVEGRIYFFDGDCYARMTRARMVDEHPGTVVQHHAFENYPEGIRSHTTAPFDYAIVALKRTLDLTVPLWAGWHLPPSLGDRLAESEWGRLRPAGELRGQTLDLAGALISPLLGALTCLYLGWWARWGIRLPEQPGWAIISAATPLFFALCPVLVEAGLLGRPDHQAPMLLTLAVALSAELSLLQVSGNMRGWATAAGLAWGFSLWLSLYEPLVLLVATGAILLAFHRPSLRRRERWWEAGLLGGVILLMLLVEGSPIPHLDPVVKEYFGRWSQSIGELQHLDPLHRPTLFRWLGYSILLAPVLLVWSGRRWDRRASMAALLLLLTFAGTCWQLRWGYFLALAFALALPWLLAPLRWRALAWGCWLLSLWPMATEWELLLFPPKEAALARQQERFGWVLLRELAGELRPRALPSSHGGSPTEVRCNGEGELPFMAPWWLSPALAYWSGQPGAAGSAHEGLSGIVDSARVYVTADRAQAGEILARRRIAYVIVDQPERTTEPAAAILGTTVPPNSLGEDLYHYAHRAAPFLVFIPPDPSCRYGQYYKLFYFDRTKLHP